MVTVDRKANPRHRTATDATPDTRSSSGISAVVSVIGVGIMGMVIGAAMADFRVGPYDQVLAPVFRATRSMQYKFASDERLAASDLWYPSRYEQRGVLSHDPKRVGHGFTLYSSGHDAAAFLIDVEGNERHQWRLPFYDVWPRPSHVAIGVHDRFVYWRRTHAFPNGDLLAIYEGIGDTPYGYGMVKIDRNSQLLWKYADNTHHDFCLDSDGSILVLTHSVRDTTVEPVGGAAHLCDQILDDFVVRLSPDGAPLQKVSLVDAIANSPYRSMLKAMSGAEWDLLHTNSVRVVTPEFAARHTFAQPGQILLSMRTCQALAVLDMDQQKIVWAQFGPYRFQHDPDLLDNGNILLFDNRGNAGVGGSSRVIEFDPATNRIAWQYAGDEQNFFFSPIRSSQQMLSNSNLLITESCAGRILEVTREGDLVWEFRNPARLESDERFIAIVCGAERYPAEKLPFLDQAGN
jgi:hypothetical protein